jgi:dihydropteroate synthase
MQTKTMRRMSANELDGTHMKKTLIMGIVNVTPDSFSDGGRYVNASRAIEHAYQLIEEGADVLDVGAESTRPQSVAISQVEEWKRLEPVLKELCRNSSIPISIDTYKARTAAEALDLGVSVVNDVWGGLADPDMLPLVASAACDYIWMHNRKQPAETQPFETLMQETSDGIIRCLKSGIAKDRLWIDPGIGFGKNSQQNLVILQRLREYCQFDIPVLLGTSRKRFIGQVVGGEPYERLEGTMATVCLGIAAGVKAVRVHDVLPTVKTSRMTEAILYATE